jgi:hypothetical protein
MSTVRRSWYSVHPRTTWVLVLLTLGLGANMSTAQESKQPSPRVASAGVPLYPRTSQLAHIEGVVRLRLSTDGKRVSTIEVESGQPMLVKAAQENVKTWEFEEHNPTTFEATFRYKILPQSECDIDNGTVLLRLPTEVEVSAKGVQTCDPAVESKAHGTGKAQPERR